MMRPLLLLSTLLLLLVSASRQHRRLSNEINTEGWLLDEGVLEKSQEENTVPDQLNMMDEFVRESRKVELFDAESEGPFAGDRVESNRNRMGRRPNLRPGK